MKGWRPTVRLYAGDAVWCSLDPDSQSDRDRFSGLIRHAAGSDSRPAAEIPPAGRPKPALRVAMVFPIKTPQPCVPVANDFAGEDVDFVLFPEGYIDGYIDASDDPRVACLKRLAAELDAPLLVGAVKQADKKERARQVLLRFDPGGAVPSELYVKHSTAGAIAFEQENWEPAAALPTFELGGVSAGATICHDAYLGLLPRYLAKAGARLWVNPSYDNVNDKKWSSVHRLRAVENRFFALCTLHYDLKRRKTHPFGFSPDGHELRARKAGCRTARKLSECTEAGAIYIVDLDMAAAGAAVEWSKLPRAGRPRSARQRDVRKPVCVRLNGGQPAIHGCSGWVDIQSNRCVETASGRVYVGVAPGGADTGCGRLLSCARPRK